MRCDQVEVGVKSSLEAFTPSGKNTLDIVAEILNALSFRRYSRNGFRCYTSDVGPALDDPPEISCKNHLHQRVLARILQERSYLASAEKSCRLLEKILQGNV